MTQIIRQFNIEIDLSAGIPTGKVWVDGTKFTLDATSVSKLAMVIPLSSNYTIGGPVGGSGSFIRVQADAVQTPTSGNINGISPTDGWYTINIGNGINATLTSTGAGYTGATIS
jgi:hypothetical protein